MINLPNIEAMQLSMLLKFLFVTFVLIGYLSVLHKVLSDHHLRKLFIQSLCDETGRVSGKSITAFALNNVLVFASLVAIYYDPKHILPSDYLYAIVALIASLYGIKEVGQYTSKKFGPVGVAADQAMTTNNTTVQTSVKDPEKKPGEEKPEEINPEKGKGD